MRRRNSEERLMKILFVALATAFLFTGCVTKLTVENSAVRVPVQGTATYAVGVIENRPYVLSGKKNDGYEGIFRALYGIPSSMENIEKKKFSDYIGDRIAQGFQNAGYKVTKLTIPKGTIESDTVSRIKSSAADYAFTLRMNDWRFDWGGFIPLSWQFWYDVDVSVYSGNGELLATHSFVGKDIPPVAGNDSIFNNSVKHYQTKFDEFLSDPEIRNALKGIKSTAAESTTPKGRLEQLKALFDAGLITEKEYADKKAVILKGL